MIVARLGNMGSGDSILMILEPGNLAKLQLGQPIIKKLKDFIPELSTDVDIIIGYSPDVQYVSEQVQKGVPFTKALEKSMKRKENFSSIADAEALHDVPLKDVKL